MTPTSFATDKEPQHMSLKLKFIIKVKIGLSVNFIPDFSVRSVSKSCDCDVTKGNDTYSYEFQHVFPNTATKVKHFLVVL